LAEADFATVLGAAFATVLGAAFAAVFGAAFATGAGFARVTGATFFGAAFAGAFFATVFGAAFTVLVATFLPVDLTFATAGRRFDAAVFAGAAFFFAMLGSVVARDMKENWCSGEEGPLQHEPIRMFKIVIKMGDFRKPRAENRCGCITDSTQMDIPATEE